MKIQATHRNCSSKGCPSQGRHREMLSICVVLNQILAIRTQCIVIGINSFNGTEYLITYMVRLNIFFF